ncbi:lasso peptide biosynthesis PqqD family chaperone [Streptomyces abikoensis]|uniref:lasso peptide biosynthesis PqqD family chaperone n=1 Tax=Streptomyces abikoensis TaxID=97398 RepID=UPI0033DFFDF1
MPSLRQDISVVAVEDGMVLLDERSGRYYHLNGSGALVLRILIEGGGEKEAADALTEHYDVPRDRVSADIGRIVRRLYGAGLMAP